jgi:hypothetical protein
MDTLADKLFLFIGRSVSRSPLLNSTVATLAQKIAPKSIAGACGGNCSGFFYCGDQGCGDTCDACYGGGAWYKRYAVTWADCVMGTLECYQFVRCDTRCGGIPSP